MDPKNKVRGGTANTAAQKAPEPTFDNGPSIVGRKDRKTGWILAIVLLLIVAAGGVGFGVWAYMDGNTQKDALNAQIDALKRQNNDSQNELDNGDNLADSKTFTNPVIFSSEPDKSYSVSFTSSEIGDSPGEVSTIGNISIGLSDGSISGCYISRKDSGSVYYSGAEECSISGVSGEIYKVVEFGAGHDNGHNNIGFIMTDGTVYYFPLKDILSGNALEIKGKVSVDGYVVDAINVVVGVQLSPDEGYSYGSYVFVLNDGTYVLFEDAMLE